VDIVTREGQVGQIGSLFDSLTILKIAFPNLNTQRIESCARQFDGIATLQASKIDNPFARRAIRKHHPQELLGELNQREVFRLPGLLRLCERPVVKPDVMRREAICHYLPLPLLEHFHTWCIGWSTASAGLFMSARSLLGVIPSDERSEESRDPFGRQPSQTCCCATRPHCDFSQL
jgi:hypothetical protein